MSQAMTRNSGTCPSEA